VFNVEILDVKELLFNPINGKEVTLMG
jgi:hypothetical protein